MPTPDAPLERPQAAAAGGPRFQESAVVVLVRGSGDGIEAFWVRRSDAVSYMPGFEAFIGGKVNPEDLELEIEGVEEGPERVMRACAVREAFEEAGVLVALAAPADPASFGPARQRLLAGEATFPTLAREHGWRFRAGDLPFAGRWTSPPFTAARFDARYYLARVPEGQEPSVRPGELASGEWVRPREAIARWTRGEATFAAPILWSLITIAEGGDDLAGRLAISPGRAAQPVRRIELKWGIVLHPMKTRALPPATHTNAYLIGEREMALVDPGGADPEDMDALIRLIEALESEGRKLKLVLLTHHHPDHVGGLEALLAHRRVPVAAHAETARHVKVDFTIADGEWIRLLGAERDWDLRAIHTPGHTRGHLCFIHPRTRSLFSGDHIPGGTGTVIIDPPEGDMAAYIASLERLTTEPVETLFPGHLGPRGAAQRRIRELIEHRLGRERHVAAALDATPRTPAELVARAYDDTPRELWGYAERSLLAHLIKLESEGRAGKEGERWRAGGA